MCVHLHLHDSVWENARIQTRQSKDKLTCASSAHTVVTSPAGSRRPSSLMSSSVLRGVWVVSVSVWRVAICRIHFPESANVSQYGRTDISKSRLWHGRTQFKHGRMLARKEETVKGSSADEAGRGRHTHGQGRM